MPPKRGAPTGASGAPPPKRAARLQQWMVTVFLANLVAAPQALLATLSPLVSYVMFQREIAPGTGAAHLQMYICFAASMTMKAVKVAIGDQTAHCEPTKGTPTEASDYCSKTESRDPAPDSGPFTFGEKPKGQGARSDLSAIQAKIDSGVSDREIAESHFASFVRYNRGFAAYRALTTPARNWQSQCIVYWGPPGSGKTRAAASYDDDYNTYWLPRPSGSGTAWWDGYSGQRTVVLDEYYGWLRRDLLQRLIDRTPLRVECKGGTIAFSARTIIFTSNVDPARWYKNAGLGALERRLADPIGAVVYVGDASYPTAASYAATLPPVDAVSSSSSTGSVHWVRDSDAVAAASVLGAGPGQY